MALPLGSSRCTVFAWRRARYVTQCSVSCLFVASLVSGRAAAQEPDRQKEVFAGGGLCPTTQIVGSCVVGGFGLQLGARNSFEVDLLYALPHRTDVLAGGWFEQRTARVLVSWVHHRGQGRNQVLVLAGVGYAANRERQARTFPGPGEVVTSSDYRRFVIGGGVGWKVFLTPAVSLRPQLRVVFGPSGEFPSMRTEMSAAIGYHW